MMFSSFSFVLRLRSRPTKSFGQTKSIGHVPLTSTHIGTYTRKAGNQDVCGFSSPRWHRDAGASPRTSAQDAVEHTGDGWGYHPSHVFSLLGRAHVAARLS